MSKSKLRDDTTCQNCGNIVEFRFCPNCGQENTETRKSFHYLFFHFIEDLVHYDSGFWKTVRNLLFRPAYLTSVYLSGKRKMFVAPIKLYIFISFITFFISGLLINPIKLNATNDENLKKELNVKDLDTIPFEIKGYKNIEDLELQESKLPENKRLGRIEKWIVKKILRISDKYTTSQLFEKFLSSSRQNLPKALFLYLPFFAFWLWLFHGKKKWYYFDHGIFTLHYFSFLLLAFTLLLILDTLLSKFDSGIIDFIIVILNTGAFIWSIVYFYKAHKRIYNEGSWMSFFKSSFLFLINIIFVFIFMAGFVIYTLININ